MARVSTLLTTVGSTEQAPAMAGMGGLARAVPRLPSRRVQHRAFFATDIGPGPASDLYAERFAGAAAIVVS